MTALDVLVPRVAAEATQRPRMRLVLPTSYGRGFASHGPLGYFVVTLVIWPAGNGGRWLGIVTVPPIPWPGLGAVGAM